MKPIDIKFNNSKITTPIYLLSFSKPKKSLSIWTWKTGGHSNGWKVLTQIGERKKNLLNNRLSRGELWFKSPQEAYQKAAHWFSLQNHEALGNTSYWEGRAGMGFAGRYRGEQGQSRETAERRVSFSDALQHVYPLPSLPTHPTAHPAHRKSDVHFLDDSGLKAPGRLGTVRERRTQNRMKWNSTCWMVESLDTFPVLLPECWQPVKLEDSALRKLQTSERQSPDNAICHLFDESPDHLSAEPALPTWTFHQVCRAPSQKRQTAKVIRHQAKPPVWERQTTTNTAEKDHIGKWDTAKHEGKLERYLNLSSERKSKYCIHQINRGCYKRKTICG